MTRQIDADALDYALGASDEDIYFHHMLEDAPTIPAIPVEWLEEQAKDNYDYSGTLIRGLLSEWQKEQEAQDG